MWCPLNLPVACDPALQEARAVPRAARPVASLRQEQQVELCSDRLWGEA